MLVLYPTLRATSQWLGPVVTRFRPVGKEVWLTIDDGPTQTDTRRILDLLDRHGARATFFVKGHSAGQMTQLTSEIVIRGHGLANHSHTHPSATFWLLPPSRIAWQIDQCNQTLRTVTGNSPRLFRAPVGMKNPFVHPLLRRRGMTLVAWSARGYDAVSHDAHSAASRILGRVRPGAILLMHEGRARKDGSSITYDCIEQVMETLSRDGYSFVIPSPELFQRG